MHVPAVRMSAEELDRELATEVKRNGAQMIVSDAAPIFVFARIRLRSFSTMAQKTGKVTRLMACSEALGLWHCRCGLS
jgi:hypothetical protein